MDEANNDGSEAAMRPMGRPEPWPDAAVAGLSVVAVVAATLIAPLGFFGSVMSVAPASCSDDRAEAERIFAQARMSAALFALLPLLVAAGIAWYQRTSRPVLARWPATVACLVAIPGRAGAAMVVFAGESC